MVSPPAKKQKIGVQIDPENPMEVHAYLMQLREDNKLEVGPMQRSEEMPVKEWMEMHYPQIFSVFPQDPKVLLEVSDKSKQNEFLYCHYWLFLFEVRSIVLIDYSVSPEHVELLAKAMKSLEKLGFDCRFLRSEFVMVRNMMKKQLEITLAVKNVIATRIAKLERELQAVTRKKENEAELDKRGEQLEEITPEIEALAKQLNKLQKDQYKEKEELNKLPFVTMEQEYFEVILDRHKKILEYKEKEGKRLIHVLEKIHQLYRG